MGYQAIKDGIGKMLVAKGFAESSSVFDFEQESDQSIDKKFQIQRLTIDTEAEGVVFLQTIVRPKFDYLVRLGFKLSEEKQQLDYDVSQNILDTVVAYFNNPTNYGSFCILMKTRRVESRLVDGHLEAEVNLEVQDDITLA